MELINAKALPLGWKELSQEAQKARAYYRLNPYPAFGFQQWLTSSQGPRPRCLPVWKSITDRGARWLFKGGIQFTGEDDLAEWANDVLDRTRLDSALLRVAREAGWCGSVLLYWKWDAEKGIQVQSYLPYWHCVVYQADDPTVIEMLRIQYPVYRAEEDQHYMFREEWTADAQAIYPLLKVSSAEAQMQRGGTCPAMLNFQEPEIRPNPWKVVPAVLVRNSDSDHGMGEGDLWGLWEMVDQANFTANLMHVDNQMRVKPHRVYIDVQPAENTEPVMDGPGRTEELESTGEGRQGEVKLLEATGAVRPHIESFLLSLLKMSHEAAGSVYLDPAEVTGFGQLSSNVVSLMMEPLISSVQEKRRTIGEDGVQLFFRRMARAMQTAKLGKVPTGDPDSLTISWGEVVAPTQAELSLMSAQLINELSAKIVSRESAVTIASVWHGLNAHEELEKLEKEAFSMDNANERETKNEASRSGTGSAETGGEAENGKEGANAGA